MEWGRYGIIQKVVTGENHINEGPQYKTGGNNW